MPGRLGDEARRSAVGRAVEALFPMALCLVVLVILAGLLRIPV